MKQQCKIEGCSTDVMARGMCMKHYRRAWMGNDPNLKTTQDKTIKERLEEKLLTPDPTTGCIEWAGNKIWNGYGIMRINGKGVYVHRLAWELKHGPIPDGKQVLHRCDNRPCCNDDHLFLGTNQDNMDDKKMKMRAAKKLTKEQVLSIRERLSMGDSQSRIAKDLGVDQSNISNIKTGKIWNHVQ
jgi:predicted XRE-type DNA-binding protein